MNQILKWIAQRAVTNIGKVLAPQLVVWVGYGVEFLSRYGVTISPEQSLTLSDVAVNIVTGLLGTLTLHYFGEQNKKVQEIAGTKPDGHVAEKTLGALRDKVVSAETESKPKRRQPRINGRKGGV